MPLFSYHRESHKVILNAIMEFPNCQEIIFEMIITQLANEIYSPTTCLLIDNTYISGKTHFLYISSLPIDFTSCAFFETKFTPYLYDILYIHHSKYTHLRKDFYSNRSNILHTAIRMIFTLMAKTFYL